MNNTIVIIDWSAFSLKMNCGWTSKTVFREQGGSLRQRCMQQANGPVKVIVKVAGFYSLAS